MEHNKLKEQHVDYVGERRERFDTSLQQRHKVTCLLPTAVPAMRHVVGQFDTDATRKTNNGQTLICSKYWPQRPRQVSK